MSALHAALTQYVATRRALGTQLAWPESALRGFVDFVEATGAEFVTTDLALSWATAPATVQRATHARRLEIVRGFAVWLQATDPRTQVPPQRLIPCGPRRPTPYIYTDRELLDLIAATRALRSRSGLRRATFRTLLGLLASTGLRPGEALALDVADVDLVTGVLTVRASKHGKTRFVPAEETARRALLVYAELRDGVHPCHESPAFLVTGRGERVRGGAARRTFATLCRETGLRPRLPGRRDGRGPRLQDIRHTFATRRLVAWYRDGCDVDRLMPRLSAYLGHVGVESTYWYLQAVPELLHLATERLESLARGDLQ